MAKDIYWTSVTFGIIIVMLVLAFWPVTKGNVVVVKYDCGIAEISPDYPVEVKEACRKKEANK